MFDVACIGILVADVISKPVDEIPERGKLGLIDRIELYTGGCAVNAAIDMAKIGLNVTLIGKIGNDVFLSMGVKVVVIKLGKNGCFIKAKSGEKFSIPTYSDIKPIDTNGAGDSFVAGFLVGLTKEWSLFDCGKFANAVGTHCVMAIGASTGIRKLEEIKEFMSRYE